MSRLPSLAINLRVHYRPGKVSEYSIEKDAAEMSGSASALESLCRVLDKPPTGPLSVHTPIER